MRILVFFTGRLLESRGTPSRSRNLTRALIAQPGNELLVLSGDPPGSMVEALEAPHESLSAATPVEKLEAAVARFRPHLIYGQTEKAAAPLARLSTGRPLTVADLHGDLAAEKLEQRWRPLGRRLRAFARHRLDEFRWLGKMDAFTVVSHHLKDRVRRFGRPTEVVWGGVDPDLFRAPPAAPAATVTVAYAGNFRPYQGLDVLIDAMSRLDERFRLLLVGDPTGGEELLARARSLLGGRLIVRDPVPYAEVPALLAAADILTVPRPVSRSGHFGFPSKLPEYLALGRAVVATDLGEQRRVIRDGENGLLVPPGSVTALAGALGRLADEGLRSRLGEAARGDAENRLSWDRIGRQLQEFLLQQVASRKQAPSLAQPAVPRR